MAADGGGADLVPGTPAHPRAPRWPWVVGVLLAVVLATGIPLVHWLRHPDVFDGGYGFSTRGQVDRTLYVALLRPRDTASGTVTIRDLQPEVRRNDADAEVSYLVCDEHRREGADGTVTAMGMGGASTLSRYCFSTRPAVGARLSLDADAPQLLVVAVTPRRSGRVVIDHHQIDYRHGLQAGTESLPVTVRVTATAG